ncbi:hypothetical protein C8035_v010256 [Colletotrichum spinosum]|uniref:Transcription factor domain-containing protein n=1 Tax=Colletotrichum spinosum TaxID=1347390 RepID=A0A4R8QFJ6_9PEZI|nr:hypothetical protein C8035_v010256 [Colletotrichum spinosum]
MIRFDIPDHVAASSNCEAILRWPIFGGMVPDVHSFILEIEDDDDPECLGQARPTGLGNMGRGVQEDDFMVLSKKFLAYVHVKNPVLDIPDFKAHVKNAIENGPRWDGPSCLVLIACALACLATPFQPESTLSGTPESMRSSASSSADPDTAQTYYFAAKKRLGLLESSLLQVQCLFFCGVFEMCLHIPSQINWQNRERSGNELVHYIQNRAESCREWIHRPFVYYVAHQPPDDPWIPRVKPLAQKCLDLSVELLLEANPHHRHHGTWFMARAAMARALLVLAAVKSGRFRLPDRWRQAVDSATWALQRWYGEAPDLRRAASVLENLVGQIL